MEKKPFFINIMPSNDRRESDDIFIPKMKKYIDETKQDFFKHTLITVGDKRIDPWVISQMAMERNPTFSPMVAVNPLIQHPFHIIKKISSLQMLYNQEVALNLIPGSFPQERAALGDTLDAKSHFLRLKEFSLVLFDFFKKKSTGDYKGNYYNVSDAKIYPELSNLSVSTFFSGVAHDDSLPGYYVKGIRPLNEMKEASSSGQGLLFGLCVRQTNEEALDALKKIFPIDRRGQMLFDIGIEGHETGWSVWMKDYLKNNSLEKNDFNLIPMRNFWSSAPFLVGSYTEVAAIIKRYIELGYEFFIVDFHPDDFSHVEECLKLTRS